MKYVVILVVALFATHLVLSRTRPSSRKTAAGESLHRAVESTIRKVLLAAGVVIAAFALIVLITHVTT